LLCPDVREVKAESVRAEQERAVLRFKPLGT
jgi:hypothetical protein